MLPWLRRPEHFRVTSDQRGGDHHDIDLLIRGRKSFKAAVISNNSIFVITQGDFLHSDLFLRVLHPHKINESTLRIPRHHLRDLEIGSIYIIFYFQISLFCYQHYSLNDLRNYCLTYGTRPILYY